MNFLAVEGKDVKEDMKSRQISTIMKILLYIVWLQNGKELVNARYMNNTIGIIIPTLYKVHILRCSTCVIYRLIQLLYVDLFTSLFPDSFKYP